MSGVGRAGGLVDSAPLRVVMLLGSEWRHDSRVIREAECLATAGHLVYVVSRRMTEEPTREHRSGVHYLVEPYASRRGGPVFLRWIISQHAWVLLIELRRLVTGPGRRSALVLLLTLFAVVPLGVVGLGLVFFLRIGARIVLMFSSTVSQVIGDWGRAAQSWLFQGVVYLNGYGERCLETIESLRPDVVHAHDLITVSAAARVAERFGLPFVYDAHELETHTNYHSLNSLTKYWIWLYEGAFVRRCTRVVTVCDSIADWLSSTYRVQRPVVVMNTPSVSAAPIQTSCRGDGLRGHLGLEPSTPLVVYVGSVTVDRGLALTVEAMALLPNVHFAVVGPRYEPTEREMVEVARRVGVENRIHLVDAVAPDEVTGFVASADCSVIPIQNVCLSYYFCFPNKLLESVLAGLPVVVADLLELRRFIERFPVGVVVDASDPRSLAAGVERVLVDPARYIPGEDTRQCIVESFGWSVQASRLLTMYRDIGDAVKPVAIGARVPSGLQS